ncbi:hypothetical protein HCU64_01310 [Methylobacterium sp. C25]|uniref:hypothetical protein n=1 Tax=Methylobacterium sp. C25 TaxID=2721622 RepID=UPI001F1943EB|nr:hypothetical protein [Methylobacterium sp. C25]MCE4222376.1 hypothetical protein [Methylobacterium sp. C25]
MRVLNWFFRDRATGAIVIAQWPNLPLWIFAGAAAVTWIMEASAWAAPPWLNGSLQIASMASLTWWAADEVLRGVNPWRRFLGGTVLLFGLLRLLHAL